MSETGGEFSLKHTGTTYAKNSDGEIASYVSWEGTATGFGVVFGTLCFTNPLAAGGATSGSCSWVGQAFLEDTTTTTALGEGTWQQVEGEQKWSVSQEIELSDGSRIRSEGEIDLAARTYTGKFS